MTFALVTFDVYSALFDIEGSLVPLVDRILGGRADAGSFVKAWRRDQMTLLLISNALGRGRMSFRAITTRALELGLDREGIELSSRARQNLVAAWDELTPWPEAVDVLETTRQQVAVMALLSNGDQDMLVALATRLPDVFDHVFSAEAAGVYKPAPGVYQLPLGRLSLPANAVLHVAGSATDVMGAKSAGLACAWSNRRGDRLPDPSLAADYAFPNLRGLLDCI